MRKSPLSKGLYTTAKGGKTVFVFDVFRDYRQEEDFVDCENVQNGKQEELSLEIFKERFPNKIDKLDVVFKDVKKKIVPEEEPEIWNLYTDKSGRSVVYVFDSSDSTWSWCQEDGGEIVFISVKSCKEGRLSWADFNKKYPHKIDKILIEFS